MMQSLTGIENGRFFQGIVESLFGKYWVSLTAGFLVTRSLIGKGNSSDAESIIEAYTRNAGLIVNLCNSMNKISAGVKEIPKLGSQISKTSSFLETMLQISEGTIEQKTSQNDRKCKFPENNI